MISLCCEYPVVLNIPGACVLQVGLARLQLRQHIGCVSTQVAVGSQVGDQTISQVGDQTDDQVGDQTESQVVIK